MITAFDCSQHFSLVGFFHGEVVLLEKEGGIVYREIPTGSRIRAVYGAAISPEEDVFAVIPASTLRGCSFLPVPTKPTGLSFPVIWTVNTDGRFL